ncbi:MAG TPA: DMT family transporter [Hypericibacter adhaerens]|uniref:DMT family transporter n=1 Tax=Hypericibacter adhaerens TaxID=2602016 RepID=UPI002C5D77B9|nr:DMT family transporter [Hypericibacter adhaerens]HWA42714.1 DMT family transporter [Hypericibacter adhaerens]
MPDAALTAGEARSRHRLGLAMVTASAIFWSSGGFFTRLIPLDLWTMLAWRGLFGGLSILLFMAWDARAPGRRRLWRPMGWPGLIVMLLNTGGMLLFIGSLRLTAVADVTVIYAILPFLTAPIAWLWFKERPTRRTMLAGLLALGGVVITVGGALGHGGSSLLGCFLAFVMTTTMALTTSITRRYPGVPMIQAACLACFAGSAICFPMAGPASGITALDFVNLALFGILNMGLGLALYVMGAKHIPAAEAALLSILETPVAPLWVWIFFAEVPRGATLLGGAVVLFAVLWQVLGSRQHRSA